MKAKPSLVICEVCRAQFPAIIYHKNIRFFPRIWKMYIRCPKCKTVYNSGYFDLEVQRMIDLGAPKESIIKYQKGLEEKYEPKVHS